MKNSYCVLQDPCSQVPVRSTSQSAGYDLFSCEDVVIEPSVRRSVRTGISLSMPEGVYGRIAPRSGLSLRHFIDIAGGVIDPDYRREIEVIMKNSEPLSYIVNVGDGIAQLIFERFETPSLVVIRELTNTGRTSQGFGSMGY